MKPVYEDPHMLKIPGEELEGEDDIFCDCVDEVNDDGDDDRRTSDGTKNFSSLYTCSNRGQSYKTFYGRNLQILVLSPFQSGTMFAGKARSLP